MKCDPKCKHIKAFFGDDIILKSDLLEGVLDGVIVENGSHRAAKVQVNFIGGEALMSEYPKVLNMNNTYKLSVENECFLIEFYNETKDPECE